MAGKDGFMNAVDALMINETFFTNAKIIDGVGSHHEVPNQRPDGQGRYLKLSHRPQRLRASICCSKSTMPAVVAGIAWGDIKVAWQMKSLVQPLSDMSPIPVRRVTDAARLSS
ncbi:hypothetical protein QLT01_08310 [Cobetia amphilecti]|uniref:Uncharacterized protein n=2 Tax=Halomonadaceae TaxID=28256 RepID=A0ABT6UPU0_9GAMM|nr:hypothetical protein [Cobetia amphilecti]MDI5884355.1 hypothetical protein [Cobetia amphilecti]UBU49095.1 hypothetical protein LCW13_02125 [Cobetia amphilecti]BBO55106.1 hypothetical protein CLAM6_04170 [Cobetia sp. AM6]